jgi:hypothetical protein
MENLRNLTGGSTIGILEDRWRRRGVENRQREPEFHGLDWIVKHGRIAWRSIFNGSVYRRDEIDERHCFLHL